MMQAWMEQNHLLESVYTLLRLNKQGNAATAPYAQKWTDVDPSGCCVRESTWTRRDAACAERQTGTCCSLNERHNKITSLPLSTTIQYFAVCILSFFVGSATSAPSVCKRQKGSVVIACAASKMLEFRFRLLASPPASSPVFNITFAPSSMQTQEPRSTSSCFEAGVFGDGGCVWGLWTFSQRRTHNIQSHLCVLLGACLCEACWHSSLPLLF